MRKTIAATLIGTLFASGAAAQVDTNRVVDYTQYTQRATPIRDSVERYAASVKKYPTVEKSRKLGPEFWLVGSALMASTATDYEITFKNKKNCEAFLANLPENAVARNGCHDSSSITDPLVQAGRPAAYAANAVANAGILYLSARMKKSDNDVIRQLWYVLPVALTVAHIRGAVNNAKGFEVKIIYVR